jgi:DNA-binding FadR family transcriptional regulator
MAKLKRTLKTQNPGGFLGSLADLAEEYGVSAPTMREALRLLESQGLITMRSGVAGGVYVADKDRRVLPMMESIRTIYNMESDDAGQLFDFRTWIEGLCTEIATSRHSPEELKELEQSVERMKRLVDRLPDEDVAEVLAENIRFHHLVAQATHNVLLFRTFESIEAVVHEQTGQPVYTKDTLQDVAYAHRKVVEAMRAGNVELASRRMRHHLEAFHRYVERKPEN